MFIFFWWDDAVTFAGRQAARTGLRQRVHRQGPGWAVTAR